MSFYGYNPENFQPDNSVWAKVGGIAAETLMKLPEAIEAEKALEEGKATNTEVYGAIKAQIDGLDDDKVKTTFGHDRATLTKLLTPGRKEGTEYLVRATKIAGEGLKTIKAMENTQSAVTEIGTPDAKMEDIKSMSPAMSEAANAFNNVMGKPNTSNPEQVQAVGRKYNVSPDQLQPEMSRAQNARTAQQLRGIDPSGVRGDQMQGIMMGGQGITPDAEKVVNSLPTSDQEAANMVAVKNAQTAGVRAESDRLTAIASGKRADADVVKTKSNELMDLRKTYISEKRTYESELSKVTDDLKSPRPYGIDDKEWEKTHKDLVNRQKRLTRDLRNTKKELYNSDKEIKIDNGLQVSDYIDDQVWEVYDEYMLNPPSKGEYSPGGDIAKVVYGIAQKYNMANVPYESINNMIKKGAKPLQIFQVLYEQSNGAQ